MISSKKLLTDLKKQVTLLENDLRLRCKDLPEIDAPLRAQYDAAKAGKRTAMTYGAWLDEQLTQVAVAWVLACVFVRFLEDNGLVEVPKLAGPGALGQRARDEHEMYFREHPTLSEREYLESVFTETGTLPAMREFFNRRHNPLWQCGPSGDAAAALLDFWRKADPDTGTLVHDFTDPDWNTRFLGDLYQDLSEAARKKYALLQTPEFIEEFILDRTLTPAIKDFGYQVVRLIDPTCGSGHFLLGAFIRLFRLWLAAFPGENPRVLAQNALNAIYGVDLNPYAVAIARFRLLLAALRVCGITKLKNAPDFTIHLASGDSLLHGARFDNQGNPYVEARQELFGGDSKEFKDELKHHYEVEDVDTLHRILGQQYHAVVGNPPYITVKDKAVSELYRMRYPSCSGKYSLSIPFMERFFDLATKGDGTPQQQAGFTGQITSNSFMKREFGKRLIEEFLPHWDLTHVLDISGAYIPGHGTPTVILFGKNQIPVSNTIRTVLGIRGEPETPEDAANGLVWQAVRLQIDFPGSESEWVSASDSLRSKFHQHPWSIGGGGAAELKDEIQGSADKTLYDLVEVKRKKANIGFASFTGLDEAFISNRAALRRSNVATGYIRDLIKGDVVRDWQIMPEDVALAPYDSDFVICPLTRDASWYRLLWHNRTVLRNISSFETTREEEGSAWWGWYRWIPDKYRIPLSITFAEVASHNHFSLDSGGNVFKQTAPIIKLPPDATKNEHLALIALLNSSTICFMMKQTSHQKQMTGGDGVRVDTKAKVPYQFGGTQLQNLPIPTAFLEGDLHDRLVALGVRMNESLQEIRSLATESAIQCIAGGANNHRQLLLDTRAARAKIRSRLIFLQEQIDFTVYAMFELAGPDLIGAEADDVPLDIDAGQRPFEILRQENIDGFTVAKAIPMSWVSSIQALWQKRLTAIQQSPSLTLIEEPHYKRRWIGRQGLFNHAREADEFKDAATEWLLARLESYFHEGSRVCERKDSFDPAAHGFIAASRPHLVSAQQLAEVVQADSLFLEVAECLEGHGGFSVSALVQRLVVAESVPALPRDRYKDSGLRKREDWEETWRLQRVEDEIEIEAAALDSEIEAQIVRVVNLAQPDLAGRLESSANELDVADQNFHRRFFPDDSYDPKKPHYKRSISDIPPAQLPEWLKLEPLMDAWSAVDHKMKFARREAASDDQVVRLREVMDQLPPKPDIPVPPKYGNPDFKKASFWKLRGKLDVPKERWVCYPGAERDGDTSPVIAWAGWDHLQQAQALAEYFLDAKDAHGWPPAKLKPLLAALADLLPWLKQWHNTFDPNYGMGLGDYFQTFLEEQCRALEMTVQEVDAVRFEVGTETARAPAPKQAKKQAAGRKRATAETPDAGEDAREAGSPGHWQDRVFSLLASKRKELSAYRMLVWPELLRQMPGEIEFETFRKAYWLLSEPTELEKLGRGIFPDVPVSWWRSRSEQLAKDEFLGTLKGSVILGDVKIWKKDGVRFVRWHGAAGPSDFPEAVDDARIALQLATLWTDEEPDAVRESLEEELVLLETT